MNRATWAWCLYDWANSALPTVVTTFVFAAYFAKAVVGDETEGTFLWGQATAAAGLLVAVTGPVLGAVADRAGRRKPWIGGFTLVAVLACAGLWFVAPDRGDIALALGLVIVTTAAFEFASVFYNAMLPDLVAANRLGRVSGWGWGIGFLGGLSALALVLVVFVNPAAAPFGLDKGAAEHIRAAMVAAALWFAVFALPLFLFTGEASGPRQPLAAAARAGLGDLWRTLRTVRRQPQLLRFLLARMAYADGLATLFALGGIYAAGTFAMDFDEIILFAIALNVTAGLGAIAFAWLDDGIGARATIMIALVGLLVAGPAVLSVESKTWFWAAALVLGVFIGPVQAASRTFMARLAPAEQRGQMFGLFALSGKATTFVGPALVGWLTLASGSQRWGMAVILALWALGLVLIAGVRSPPAD